MPVQSTYDPLSPTPYQPVPTPEQPPAPTPNIPTPSPFEGQPGFQFQGHGNISHAGAVAGVLDNVLRGYVNGKAQGDAVKGLRLKKKSDDLNSSYKADADRLWTVTQKQISEKGAIDPNSDEYKQALSAVQGSWGALQDFRGSLLDDGKKKKPGKNGQERSPAEILSDPKSTPQEKAQALHGMTQKLGPPILGQIQNYQAQAKARAQNPEVQDADIRAKANLELSQLRTQKEPLTEAQQARVKQLQDYLTPPIKETGTTRLYESPDKSERKWLVPGQEPRDWNAVESSAQAGGKPVRAFKVGANGKPTSVLLDPKTNQEIPGSENPEIVPPSGMLQHISSGFYFYTDQNGDVHKVPVTRSSGAVLPKPEGGPVTVTESFSGKTVPGMMQQGNVDLSRRPNINNGDGTHSSVFSMSFGTDKGEVLVPGVGDGTTYPLRKLTPKEALDQYQKTGKFIGIFKDEKSANAYAETLHEDQAAHGNNTDHPNHPRTSGPKPPTVNSAAGHRTNSDGDVIGHKGPISRAKIDQLDKDTQTQYQKAVDAFNKQVDDLNAVTPPLSAEQKNHAKKLYYDRLQEENHNIGKEHSDRMRDMGLSPAEDSSPKKDSLGIL